MEPQGLIRIVVDRLIFCIKCCIATNELTIHENLLAIAIANANANVQSAWLGLGRAHCHADETRRACHVYRALSDATGTHDGGSISLVALISLPTATGTP